ncbi:MAG: hypothetical protein PF572_02195 [Patescibacteria group bacterium]|jgi:hypothetical protein|nr:hypothetical protein [Patescibacteria group bacterium]
MKVYLKNLIQTITTGTPAEVKVAQKQVKKFWHDFYIPNRKEGRLAFRVFLEKIKTFDQIKDIDHQAYFINTLKWPLWGGVGEDYFEEWAEFFLKHIQNSSGKIRQAVICATEYLIHDLRLDRKRDFEIIRSQGLERKEFEKIVESNITRFGNFVMDVEDLIDRNFEARFKKYKYISSLPVSVYKSLNILITEVLFRSDYYKSIYQDFLNGLRAKRKGFESPKLTNIEILERRREMEENLAELIKRTNSVLTMEEIKEMIYNEDGQDCMRKLMANFMKDQGIEQINKDWQIVSSAWNYWPHKKLGGLSPAEKVLEYQ